MAEAHPLLKTKAGLGLIALAALGFVGAFASGSGTEKQIFIEREGYDFKNARVLGTPERLILDGEEKQLAKAKNLGAEVQASQEALRAEITALRDDIAKLKAPIPETTPTPTPSPIVHELSAAERAAYEKASKTAVDQVHVSQAAPDFGFQPPVRDRRSLGQGKTFINFPVKAIGNGLKAPSVVLPSGAYVKAKLLTGVEAPEGRSYPALLELDYAYIVPNQKRLDLSGCFMISKAQGDLSTERVQMQAVKLSCVSRRGGFFEREVNGFVADDVDNSFAVMGTVNSKQDRVAAMAFLASIVQGIGKAVQTAQTTSQTTPLGGSQSIVTGDQAKYIAAGGASEAASQVTQWYLKQAENLLPTINVGSGQNVWVVMQDSVDLPKDYFTQTIGGNLSDSIYSHFTRLLR